MSSLEIYSSYSKVFNTYLADKIKADFKKSAFYLNRVFFFRGKEYSIIQCIDDFICVKGRLFFKNPYVIKHLIYNNKQLFWLLVLKYYRDNINREYLIWSGKIRKANHRI